MGLVELASDKSLWRGVDYCENKKVVSLKKEGFAGYQGRVSGSDNKVYDVHIDKEHPRKSTCTCPFAAGRRVICKHMIAVYFTAEPQAKEDFLVEVEQWEAEEEQRELEHYKDLEKYVKSLSKSELQVQLLDALINLEESRNYW
ncbi:SWIM zinc finger family protein [Pseudobutyrivibrio xylanivorans]|uniref:SWIM zinc finger n=1 Tax=Pseudobutyrivibrio xylanivorans DSM 14809 TaxID=1123012 RepID=A0A1M6KH14_PSEXY|nr:SWIM zinc finger family protein [Pseudobutyrivibrio xylanivorans]SHJ58245.1 SWIM zinc finger [Pseudobutyrivibrio xylanivorans DSM 14809]